MGVDTEDSVSQDNSTVESPDVGFRMAEPTVAAGAAGVGADVGSAAVQEHSAEPEPLVNQVAAELFALLPAGWDRLDAAVAMTVSDEAARVVVSDQKHAVPVPLSARAIELLRELRHQSAQLEEGPWWRVLASVDKNGSAQIEYDHGAEPFPDQHLFPPQAYLADLQIYSRRRLPVWLAAYIGHDDRQVRTPSHAANARAGDGAFTSRVENDLPALPLMWARWAAIAAAFVAADSQWGPRVTTSLGWFEGTSRSGSTLHLLPRGRAVLSGGLWNDPRLDAAYNGGIAMPQLYRGAPDWVAGPVLNPRAANGLLSFCYWWDGAAWHCGESPAPAELEPALPGVRTSASAVDVITELNAGVSADAAAGLVAAAESGTVTRQFATPILAGQAADTDSAYYQLLLAGVVRPE
ncbi:hypothetical protein GFY24_18980 [Nocardia sp. SYP-A9097]|uniref:hypothetical protein n=1 Tax=Nocardia sp. SYP-A9097 TaxID=2663237 RepID=UPI00129A8EEB|nr:hypothetical protein [Nocardia sp. SYP-A9097]MRH89505.1 hypothetical protein [Nocardia sp. SYP-A9097]